ncbi:unnamed protein product [Periconia digitata]|uniref:Glucose-methanol-choline oxidoreductase N-terminal domain-containing protein n=1 Tax=Periconia digitata TaxID=1303443 RepID=A0A9W4XVU1_9PLEO|nr:unnamed protein product [Periconia digitata]
MARSVSVLAVVVLFFSLFFKPSHSLPFLDSILKPFTELLESVANGNGIIDTTLGTLEGALGYDATFDYVVVGGGTAGNAIGVRLADAGHTVAIVEAGGYYQIGKPILGSTPFGDTIGIGSSVLDTNPLVDWGFVTAPQEGLNGRQIHYARGKCLGGSSALNFMVYQRGTKGSYAKWAELVGDSSYEWDNILKYFKKSISFTPPNTDTRLANATTMYDPSAFDASGGPIQVAYTNYVSAFPTWLSKGFEAAGIKEVKDFNSGFLIGQQYGSSTIDGKSQTRSSSDQFINKAKNNENLKVYIGTIVKKILFDEAKKATGVRVSTAGINYDLLATKEVIVSAGAFQSPQLLMVSGIGPADQLEALDIPVISNLPGVGQNMWDHVMVGPTHEVDVDTLSRVIHDPVYLADALLNYTLAQDGPLTSTAFELVGWEKVPSEYRANFSASTIEDLKQFPDDWPESELLSAGGYIADFVFPLLMQPVNNKQYASILGALVAPTSRGNITIQSRSTLIPPIINPNLLATKTDQEVALAMWKRNRAIWKSTQLSPIVLGGEAWPGEQIESDEDILNMIRESAMTLWHASCTCKMGRSDDVMAVVDSKARVFGVEGVRVVDASSFPLLPPGHPQSSIYMLAEKIADDIIRGL